MKKCLISIAFLFLMGQLFSQGNALYFDGTDDHVDIPNTPLMQFTGDVTFEAWCNPSATDGQRTVFINSIEPAQYWGFFIAVKNGLAHVSIVINAVQYGVLGTTPISTGNWYHIAGVREGTSLKIYVNGVLENSLTIPSGNLRHGDATNRIGAAQLFIPAYYYVGYIDEIRAWDYARSASEILSNYNHELNGNETGLVAYYNFNQGVAGGNNTGETTLYDGGPYGLHGTLSNFALSGPTSNWVASGAVLPIELISLRAGKLGDSIVLSWHTATETNNQGFSVEKSMDGKSWKQIGFVEGNGTTLMSQNYQFKDLHPSNGTNYYRLKQLDFDGRFEYSPTIGIEWDLGGGQSKIQLYPNPGGDELCISNHGNGPAQMHVFDSAGRRLIMLEVGSGQRQCVDISNWQAGVYMLKINVNGKVEQQKFIKL